MITPTLSGWKRGGLVAVLIAVGLTVALARPGRSQDEPKKERPAGAKADDKKADDKGKTEEKGKADDPKPEPALMPPSGGSPQTATINELLAKFWKDNNARPSRKATDYEFIRRVYLDLLGRIPAIWEVKQYVDDPNRSSRRARLIHRLLHDKYYEEEFQNHWADEWSTALLTRSGNRTYHDQMHVWLEEKIARNAPWDEMVRELLTATGENNDNGAVNYILAHLGEPQQDRSVEGQFDAVPITSRTTRLFLGLQIQCTQCHNHPFNPEWKQNHFWGVNAFFRQVQREGTPLMRNQQRMQTAAKLGLKDDAGSNVPGKVFFEDRQAVMHQTGPRFLDGKKMQSEGKATRREALADFLIEHDQFPKAFVNRMWGHFFGRGLNQNAPVDDFGEHNPVIHPELLEGLAKAFKEYKYNTRELMSWICNSEAYNLSCEANKTNDKPEHEVYFSRMLLKSMSPEQLYESLKTALDQPLKPTAKTANNAKKPAARAAAVEAFRRRNQGRQDWLSKLTRNFGDDEGNEIHFNGTVVQALLLMNGRELQTELARPVNNTVTSALLSKSSTPLDEVCLAALGRRATDKERGLLRKAGTIANPQMFYEDVLWALLNSSEFILNH